LTLDKLRKKYAARYFKVRLVILGIPMFLVFAPAYIIADIGEKLLDSTERYIYRRAERKARKEYYKNENK